MICFACNQEKNKKALGYDLKSLKTYCLDVYYCQSDKQHPKTELIPADDINKLKEAIPGFYEAEAGTLLNKMIGKTTGMRLTPHQALHVLQTAEKNDLHSINETMIFILERDAQANALNTSLAKEDYEEVIEEFTPPTPQPEEIKVIVNEKPIEVVPIPVTVPEDVEEKEEEDNDEWEI